MNKIKTDINIAKNIISQYEIDTEVYIVDGLDYGSYNVIRDCIFLNEHYNSCDEFLLTLLHEIRHALDNKRLGKKYLKKMPKRFGTFFMKSLALLMIEF